MRKLSVLMLALVLALSFSLSAMAEEATTEFVPGPKLGDVRVRQALLYSLDRANFILAEYGSTDIAQVGLAPISPTSWAFPDEEDLNAYEYDLEKAAALLDEAGWTMGDDGFRYNADGERLTLQWLVYTDSPWPGTLSSMAYDSWGQIGIDLVIEQMDFNTVSDRTMDAKPGEKDFDIYTMGFSLSVDPDPSGALFDADAYSEGGFNASGFRDERSQELIKLGKETFDQEERAAYYKEWAILQNELVPTTIVAYRSEIWGVNNAVQGLDKMNAYQKWDELIHTVTLDREDQVLKFGESSFDWKFNPIISDQVYDSYIVDCIFDAIVRNNEEGEYVPWLGEFELTNDNRTYEVTLPEDAVFSDGTPLTADDVLFTYMMIAHPDYTGPRLYAVSGLEGYQAYVDGEADTISGLEVIDDQHINFTFEIASPANVEHLSYGIMSRAYYEKDTYEEFLQLVDAPMGCGRLVLSDTAVGEFIMLEPNDTYYNEDEKVQVESVYITVVPEESKLSALQLGQLDFIQATAKLENVEFIEAAEDLSLVSYIGNGYTYMCFNTLH